MPARPRSKHLPDPLPEAPLPIWQIDEAVLDIVAEQQCTDRAKLHPGLRPVQDLHIDSLDFLDLLFQIEAALNITAEKELAQKFFTQDPFTLHHFSQMVFHCWGTGAPPKKFFHGSPKAKLPDFLPSTQLGGTPTSEELAAGPLLVSLNPLGPVATYQRKTDGMRCARIPSGRIELGSDDASNCSDESPRHAATLTSYLIDAEPVSTAAFARFLNAVGPVPEETRLEWCDVNDHRKECFQLERIDGRWKPIAGTEQHPMVLVSWFGANAYSLWANRRDWRLYRGNRHLPSGLSAFPAHWTAAESPPGPLGSLLPSEAQWEHAAQAPADSTASSPSLPWAAQHEPGTSYSAASMPMLPVSAAAGISRFGLCHMPGNVWQWCRDFYAPHFYRSPMACRPDPEQTTPTSVRSERGGSWVGRQFLATPTYRRARVPEARGRCLGFRCVSLISDLS
jgi:acyl carrier protein